jgi:AraC-like DNA-binding protein
MPQLVEARKGLRFSNDAQILLGRVAFHEMSGASACAEISTMIRSFASADELYAIRNVLLRLVCGLERSAGRTLTAAALARYLGSLLCATRPAELLRAFDSYAQSWLTAPADRPETDRRIDIALQLVASRLSDPALSIDEIARAVGLSRWHFQRLFHRVTGHSFTWYVRRVRLERAVHLLEHSMLSVKEISGAVGYTHPGNFNRQCRQILQLTPTQWRRAAARNRSA